MAFQHQVAGHPASISFSPLSSDGSSLVKPCTPTEYEFYSSTCHTVTREAFAGVWIPEFWGTLKLQPGSVEEAAGRIADASGRIRSEQPDEKEVRPGSFVRITVAFVRPYRELILIYVE